jgi:predicted nuclease with TOPRIM domain
LEACAVEIRDLKHQIDHYSRYSVLSPLCETCDSLKGKLFHATKENTELKQEVAYLTSHLERTVVSEKMIEDDLTRVEKSATKSTYCHTRFASKIKYPSHVCLGSFIPYTRT